MAAEVEVSETGDNLTTENEEDADYQIRTPLLFSSSRSPSPNYQQEYANQTGIKWGRYFRKCSDKLLVASTPIILILIPAYPAFHWLILVLKHNFHECQQVSFSGLISLRSESQLIAFVLVAILFLEQRRVKSRLWAIVDSRIYENVPFRRIQRRAFLSVMVTGGISAISILVLGLVQMSKIVEDYAGIERGYLVLAEIGLSSVVYLVMVWMTSVILLSVWGIIILIFFNLVNKLRERRRHVATRNSNPYTDFPLVPCIPPRLRLVCKVSRMCCDFRRIAVLISLAVGLWLSKMIEVKGEEDAEREVVCWTEFETPFYEAEWVALVCVIGYLMEFAVLMDYCREDEVAGNEAVESILITAV